MAIENNRSELLSKETLTVNEYIANRVLFKIRLYFKKSKFYKFWYRGLLLLTLIFGALVPVFVNWQSISGHKDIATVFSILVIVFVSIETTFQFRETYKNYKLTEDKLTTQLHLFQTNSEPYNLNDKTENFKNFVSEIESIIALERKETIKSLTKAQVKNPNK